MISSCPWCSKDTIAEGAFGGMVLRCSHCDKPLRVPKLDDPRPVEPAAVKRALMCAGLGLGCVGLCWLIGVIVYNWAERIGVGIAAFGTFGSVAWWGWLAYRQIEDNRQRCDDLELEQFEKGDEADHEE